MLNKNTSKLVLSDVCKDFFNSNSVTGTPATSVLKEINIEFLSNKTYAITGVSGSGKSTLLHIAGGLDTPSRGRVYLDEKDINFVKPRVKEKILNQEFGFVFQFHYLIKEFTVLENVILAGLVKGEPRKKCETHASELLDLVGIINKKDFYPGQLSGGEQQRVAIARAIFNKPSFLLADEPTGNLDCENAQKIVDLLLKAKTEWNMGIILCSHDAKVYDRMEHIFTLHDGTLTKK